MNIIKHPVWILFWGNPCDSCLFSLACRYSVNGGLPAWAWTVLTLINAIFSIALVYNH